MGLTTSMLLLIFKIGGNVCEISEVSAVRIVGLGRTVM